MVKYAGFENNFTAHEVFKFRKQEECANLKFITPIQLELNPVDPGRVRPDLVTSSIVNSVVSASVPLNEINTALNGAIFNLAGGVQYRYKSNSLKAKNSRRY